MDKASGDFPLPVSEVCYQYKDSNVHHWIACINGEECETGQDTYETPLDTNTLESDDMTQGMVMRPSKHATRKLSPPKGTGKTNLYRCLKCRLGHSFKSRIYRRALVSTRKTPTHQSTRTEGSFSDSAILQEELHQQLIPHCLRQHLRGVIH